MTTRRSKTTIGGPRRSIMLKNKIQANNIIPSGFSHNDKDQISQSFAEKSIDGG